MRCAGTVCRRCLRCIVQDYKECAITTGVTAPPHQGQENSRRQRGAQLRCKLISSSSTSVRQFGGGRRGCLGTRHRSTPARVNKNKDPGGSLADPGFASGRAALFAPLQSWLPVDASGMRKLHSCARPLASEARLRPRDHSFECLGIPVTTFSYNRIAKRCAHVM